MDGNGYPPTEDHREHRDRDRDRGDRGDRDRDRDRSDRRDRDRDRGDRGDRDRHKSSRHRSRSRSRSRDRRSRSPARRQRRRPTQWDVLPEGGVLPTLAPSQVPGMLPGLIPGLPSLGLPLSAAGLGLGGLGGLGTLGLGGLDASSMAAAGMAALGGLGLPTAGAGTHHSQQATRHARRVYVGGLPPTAEDAAVSNFFSHALAAIGGNTAGPGQSVVNVYMNKDKGFAFIEFRTVEETSNAMALDGIMFEGVAVRIRRPNDYNAAAAALIGPSTPSPALNLAAIGLGGGAGAGVGAGGGGGGAVSAGQDQDRVFVGGLPYHLAEAECRELLGSFGGVKSFDLVKDRDTGLSKGYGFVVYADPNIVDIACAGLNGLKMGDRTLTVRRAAEGANTKGIQSLPTMDVPLPGVMLPGMGLSGLGVPAGASRILVLKNAVEVEELQSDTDYEEICQDMEDECKKHGTMLKLTIPRPSADTPAPVGLGLIIIEYGDAGSALRAKTAMHGRKFGGHTVEGTFLNEADYAAGNYHNLGSL